MRAPTGRTPVSWALAAMVLLAACDDPPTLPLPARVYDFRLQVPVGAGGDGGPRTFHWNAGDRVEVIVVGEDTPGRPSLTEALEAAVERWNRAAVFSEVTVAITQDPARARAVLMWEDSEPIYAIPQGCTGPTSGAAATRGCLTDDGSALQVWPRRTGGDSRLLFRMIINRNPDPELTPAFLETLVTHEIGHALGILNHSDDSEDLMWGGRISSPELSEADRATLRALYQTAPDLGF